MNYKDLAEDVKKRLRDVHRYINVGDFEWWDGVYDWAKEDAAKFGLDIKDIYFSGFSSQGDGASFVGELGFKECDVTDLNEGAKALYDVLAGVYGLIKIVAEDSILHVCIEQRSTRYHEKTMGFDYTHYGASYNSADHVNNILAVKKEEIEEALRDYARWIYRTLEKDYDYLTSDEAIDEYLDDYTDYNEEGEEQ
jgi:hypothetical protein